MIKFVVIIYCRPFCSHYQRQLRRAAGGDKIVSRTFKIWIMYTTYLRMLQRPHFSESQSFFSSSGYLGIAFRVVRKTLQFNKGCCHWQHSFAFICRSLFNELHDELIVKMILYQLFLDMMKKKVSPSSNKSITILPPSALLSTCCAKWDRQFQ